MLSLSRQLTDALEHVAYVLHTGVSALLRLGSGVRAVAVRARPLAVNSATGLGIELPFK
jgi:hypothetical protein